MENVKPLPEALPTVEHHPLRPFVPAGARLLMLGSFPPPRRRWSMDFFYPNFTNDMWRIFGHLYFGSRDAFVDAGGKRFKHAELVDFLTQKGVALYDAAQTVRRLQGNASDKFLEIVEPTDVAALLRSLPQCRAVAATGQKSAEVLAATFGVEVPKVGQSVPVTVEGRSLLFFRMPSSSRAYPMSPEKKAEAYGTMLRTVGLLE